MANKTKVSIGAKNAFMHNSLAYVECVIKCIYMYFHSLSVYLFWIELHHKYFFGESFITLRVNSLVPRPRPSQAKEGLGTLVNFLGIVTVSSHVTVCVAHERTRICKFQRESD